VAPSAKARRRYINAGQPLSDTSDFGAKFIRGLAQRGYTLGHNLAFERRGAQMHIERLPQLLDQLVASKVDVILAINYPAARAAKEGATTVPVVIFAADDPQTGRFRAPDRLLATLKAAGRPKNYTE
jgi:ABC-type uncharacterized transport system substrate-binding protein